MFVALAFVAGYLVGSAPLGLWVGRAFAGIDVRLYGTGGIGASNVRRTVGLPAAVLVAFGIFLQGLAPPLLARLYGASETVVVAAALGAVIGYGWPVFARSGSKARRGVGLSTGAAAVIFPGGFAPLVVVGYGFGWLFGQMGLTNFLGFVVYTGWTLHFADLTATKLGAVLLLVLFLLRRLAGIGEDLGRSPLPAVVFNRLVFDRRPASELDETVRNSGEK